MSKKNVVEKKTTAQVVDAEMVTAEMEISKAVKSSGSAGLCIAYNLNVMNVKRPTGESFLQSKGFKDVKEYAHTMWDFKESTAHSYAHVGKYVRKSFAECRYETPFAEHGFTENPDGTVTVDPCVIVNDFKVSQLIELKSILEKHGITAVQSLLYNGVIGYDTPTFKLRAIAKYIKDKALDVNAIKELTTSDVSAVESYKAGAKPKSTKSKASADNCTDTAKTDAEKAQAVAQALENVPAIRPETIPDNLDDFRLYLWAICTKHFHTDGFADFLDDFALAVRTAIEDELASK